MSKFSVVKKGYSISEVDDFVVEQELETSRILKEKQDRIDELRQENIKLSNQLKTLKQKEESISSTLVYAQERAKEIENNSKLKYETELKNLDDFYNKWQVFFDELVQRYPLMKDFDSKNVMDEIKKDIKDLFKNEFHIQTSPKKSYNSFEDLLDKLKTHRVTNHEKNLEKVVITTNKNPDKEKFIESENEIEFMNESNKMNNIKPITNLTLSQDEQDEYDSLVDKFLHSSNKISKGYENSILNKGKNKKSDKYPTPNESGFDLEQALNPTDDLLKIMKGFKLD